MAANLTTKLGQLVDVLTPDTTNTRIGVANASPTRTLDVTGTFGASGASTLGGALTYGGITLSNAVTGTGNMVLSASPTLTGILTAATGNFSGNVSAPNYYSAAAAFRVGYLSSYAFMDVYGSAGDIITFGITGAEKMRLNSSGLGIGMTPSNVLDITQNQASNSYGNLLNSTSNGAAYWRTTNGTYESRFGIIGTAGAFGGFANNDTVIYGSSAITIATAGAIKFAPSNGGETARITSSGLGIGMTPVNVLDITQSVNGQSLGSILNSNAGVNANAKWFATNGTNWGTVGVLGQSFTTTGAYVAGYGFAAGNTGMSIIAQGGPILFASNGTAEVARFDTSGRLFVGTTSGDGKLTVDNGTTQGTVIVFFGYGTGGQHRFCNVSNDSSNGAATGYYIGRNGSTFRSINAGGTINASGADYAEYMTKADACGTVAKGEIVGVNIDGKLTDKFANSHSFVIKSTDPSYVGGDTWGVALDGSELEAARQKVDRIAFSGQVPVNVTGATVGDYIIPVAGPDGGIAGEAVTNPTFDQYRAAVGRVWKILEDGRAFVSVKVS
jgi:hypothetical protein